MYVGAYVVPVVDRCNKMLIVRIIYPVSLRNYSHIDKNLKLTIEITLYLAIYDTCNLMS